MLAIIVGVSAGYFAGSGGELLSLLSNIFLVIPGLPLLIVLTSYVPQASVWVIALVLSIVGWAWGARVLRAQTLALRQQDFVQAARAAGESNFRIILFEILPNEVAVVATNAVFAVVGAISFYVAIVFLGLGNINTWSWGTMLYYAENNEAITSGAWWWYVPPGIAVALILLALVMLNFGIDEFINPRLRAAGIGRKELRAASRQQGITPVRANRPNVTPVAVGADTVTSTGPSRHGHLQAEDQVSAPSASLAGAGQPVLEIRDLCVDYGRGDQAVHAVIDTDLTLRRGEVVGLAGESGSGKSTLAYGATRLLRQPAIITGGSVLFRPDAQRPDFAIDILDASPEVLRSLRWRDVAIVFQSAMNSLNPVLTVQAQLTDTLAAHIPDASKTERRERAAELLKLVGISADRLRSFPARAVWRHEAARDDRDGAGARTSGRDHGRADHCPGRRHPAADPGAGDGAARPARLLRPFHHPRPVAAARDGRHHRDHVCRADRRVSSRASGCSAPRAIRTVPRCLTRSPRCTASAR